MSKGAELILLNANFVFMIITLRFEWYKPENLKNELSIHAVRTSRIFPESFPSASPCSSDRCSTVFSALQVLYVWHRAQCFDGLYDDRLYNFEWKFGLSIWFYLSLSPVKCIDIAANNSFFFSSSASIFSRASFSFRIRSSWVKILKIL